MMFTDEQLNSFIALYEQEFGNKLDRAQALEQATALVSLVKLTYIPMSKKDYDECSKLLEKDDDYDIIEAMI